VDGRDPGSDRDSHDVVEFQGAVLGGKVVESREVLEVLRTLAQDLDNYEADPRVRKEDPSFFGDKDARALCVEALAALASKRKP
jgi:hypothetical protein